MGIGSSSGAFYKDQFHRSAGIDANKFDDKGMVITPEGYETNKKLENVDMKELGGIPIADVHPAEKTYGHLPLGNTITDKDIDTGIGLALGFSGGGLKTEAVKSAALRYKGEMFEAPQHWQAFEDFQSKYPDMQKFGDVEQGFTTTKGNFLSREDAFKMAKENDQLIDKGIPPVEEFGLLSEDLK